MQLIPTPITASSLTLPTFLDTLLSKMQHPLEIDPIDSLDCILQTLLYELANHQIDNSKAPQPPKDRELKILIVLIAITAKIEDLDFPISPQHYTDIKLAELVEVNIAANNIINDMFKIVADETGCIHDNRLKFFTCYIACSCYQRLTLANLHALNSTAKDNDPNNLNNLFYESYLNAKSYEEKAFELTSELDKNNKLMLHYGSILMNFSIAYFLFFNSDSNKVYGDLLLENLKNKIMDHLRDFLFNFPNDYSFKHVHKCRKILYETFYENFIWARNLLLELCNKNECLPPSFKLFFLDFCKNTIDGSEESYELCWRCILSSKDVMKICDTLTTTFFEISIAQTCVVDHAAAVFRLQQKAITWLLETNTDCDFIQTNDFFTKTFDAIQTYNLVNSNFLHSNSDIYIRHMKWLLELLQKTVNTAEKKSWALNIAHDYIGCLLGIGFDHPDYENLLKEFVLTNLKLEPIGVSHFCIIFYKIIDAPNESINFELSVCILTIYKHLLPKLSQATITKLTNQFLDFFLGMPPSILSAPQLLKFTKLLAWLLSSSSFLQSVSTLRILSGFMKLLESSSIQNVMMPISELVENFRPQIEIFVKREINVFSSKRYATLSTMLCDIQQNKIPSAKFGYREFLEIVLTAIFEIIDNRPLKKIELVRLQEVVNIFSILIDPSVKTEAITSDTTSFRYEKNHLEMGIYLTSCLSISKINFDDVTISFTLRTITLSFQNGLAKYIQSEIRQLANVLLHNFPKFLQKITLEQNSIIATLQGKNLVIVWPKIKQIENQLRNPELMSQKQTDTPAEKPTTKDAAKTTKTDESLPITDITAKVTRILAYIEAILQIPQESYNHKITTKDLSNIRNYLQLTLKKSTHYDCKKYLYECTQTLMRLRILKQSDTKDVSVATLLAKIEGSITNIAKLSTKKETQGLPQEAPKKHYKKKHNSTQESNTTPVAITTVQKTVANIPYRTQGGCIFAATAASSLELQRCAKISTEDDSKLKKPENIGIKYLHRLAQHIARRHQNIDLSQLILRGGSVWQCLSARAPTQDIDFVWQIDIAKAKQILYELFPENENRHRCRISKLGDNTLLRIFLPENENQRIKHLDFLIVTGENFKEATNPGGNGTNFDKAYIRASDVVDDKIKKINVYSPLPTENSEAAFDGQILLAPGDKPPLDVLRDGNALWLRIFKLHLLYNKDKNIPCPYLAEIRQLRERTCKVTYFKFISALEDISDYKDFLWKYIELLVQANAFPGAYGFETFLSYYQNNHNFLQFLKKLVHNFIPRNANLDIKELMLYFLFPIYLEKLPSIKNCEEFVTEALQDPFWFNTFVLYNNDIKPVDFEKVKQECRMILENLYGSCFQPQAAYPNTFFEKPPQPVTPGPSQEIPWVLPADYHKNPKMGSSS